MTVGRFNIHHKLTLQIGIYIIHCCCIKHISSCDWTIIKTLNINKYKLLMLVVFNHKQIVKYIYKKVDFIRFYFFL